MTPKERLKWATAREMDTLVKTGRARSERQRAFDDGRVAERARIVALLRREARSLAGLHPVDRVDVLEAIATELETGVWSRQPGTTTAPWKAGDRLYRDNADGSRDSIVAHDYHVMASQDLVADGWKALGASTDNASVEQKEK